ncbi:class I SAM-dependent methyltransferase [Nafulsella turpanensis]|uniref:class I SAM-dependent methyltransferase n=1 Tax=Nafulsella turpanensis TaxID=1265690 RepID=UPI00034A222E|nr:methyltransferase domain-containing protein [Nafulsella turpanensis]
MRKPFQGTWNIIRFNWHFYVGSVVLVLLLYFIAHLSSSTLSFYLISLCWLILLASIVSLLVSFCVYDLSKLYRLDWLEKAGIQEEQSMVNIHAGFDETSVLLRKRYPDAQLTVLDFYDPIRHTEISIKRARKVYPFFPETLKVSTTNLPLADNVADHIFVFFSAHEIREMEERIMFFNELRRILKPSGKIVVTEHLRDVPNFIAYNIGFFHFYSLASWQKVFRKSYLLVQRELKHTPFVSSFILVKNGASS